MLVAEDNAVNQQVAQAFLAELGCEVTLADDGEQAVAMAGQQTFDLVLMDCMMPRLDGYAATAAIREAEAAVPGRRRVPVIALTASALPGERERCLQAGMDDFLSKPLSVEALRTAVLRWSSARPSAAEPADATAPLPAPAHHPIDPGPAELDPAALDRLRMVGTDGVSLLQKLIGVYLADTPAKLTALGVAAAGNDLGAVRLIAHTLKSSSALLGAARLASRFAELESRAGEGAEGSMNLLAQIQQEYARTAMALELRRDSEMTHA